MKEKVKKIVKWIVSILVGAAVALVVVVFFVSKLSGAPVFLFNKTTMWVVTGSMDPTIPARTYILVEKVTADEVKEGDVIAFVSSDPQIYGSINTHRVIEKTADGFLTKGDANAVADVYFPKNEDVVGRYVKNLPFLTFVGRIVTSPVGFATIIALLLVLTAICYLPDLKKAAKLREKEAEEEKKREMERRVQEEVQKMIEENKRKGEEHDQAE